ARDIEADVLSFDYYHIMASPEWEDADFAGKINDDFFPDWWAVELKGFRRPRWFAAGPLDACIRYLLAKTAGTRGTAILWHALELERWLLCRRHWTRDAVTAGIRKLTGRTVAFVEASANALLLTACGRWLRGPADLRFFRATSLAFRLRCAGNRLVRHGRTANLYGDHARHKLVLARYFT